MLSVTYAQVRRCGAGSDRGTDRCLDGTCGPARAGAAVRRAYDTYLDHARQTFEGRPDPSGPSTQAASFTTTCTAQGCVAHWLRVAELSDNPNAPALFDYRWNGDRWESSADYPFHCGAGGTVTAARSDFLIPNGDGSFWGERTFTVGAPGCPGDGPGTYWLPFTLTPTS